jgi:hypothetical protein
METQEQEYVEAYISFEYGSEGSIYVSQETTRAIVADAWSGLEKEIRDANAALNATADDPHERILTILQALHQAVKYADAIYTLTPLPDEDESADPRAEASA